MSKAKEGEARGRFDADRGFPEESKYPNEFIHNDKSGVKIKMGQDKDKEYIQVLHPMGTSVTIWPDGKMEMFSRGEMRTYAKGGMTTTVDGNMDTAVSQHSKTSFAGGVHIEVAGDAGIVAGGDVAIAALGGSIGMQCNNLYVGGSGALNMNFQGKATIEAPTITLKGDVNLGDEGGELVHRKGDKDSDNDVAVESASKVRAV